MRRPIFACLTNIDHAGLPKAVHAQGHGPRNANAYIIMTARCCELHLSQADCGACQRITIPSTFFIRTPDDDAIAARLTIWLFAPKANAPMWFGHFRAF
jgi:hypothetical protein